MKPTLLIVEDDAALRARLEALLADDYDVHGAGSADEAARAMASGVDVVLSDVRLGDQPEGGLEVLEHVKQVAGDVPVVVMSAYGSMRIAVQAFRAGAEDFLPKPIDIEYLQLILRRAVERRKLRAENVELRARLAENSDEEELIGESPAILEIKRKIAIAAYDSNITVLIAGETGTGKELIARSIHRLGRRAGGPLVARNLKEIENRELLPSILFGHERGSFTGAQERRAGLFEQASGGVLFLDEISELDDDTQLKLLRIIEARRYTRLGGREELSTDFQLITATNADLQPLVASGRFREDFYYRLMVFAIQTSPLREHLEDLPALAQHFLERLHAAGRTTATSLSSDTVELLRAREWRGNVRELRNAVEVAALYANIDGAQQLEAKHLPVQDPMVATDRTPVSVPESGVNISRRLAEVELAYIEAALEKCGGRRGDVYRVLGYKHRDYPRRQTLRLFGRYPDLIDRFALLRDTFGGSSRLRRVS